MTEQDYDARVRALRAVAEDALDCMTDAWPDRPVTRALRDALLVAPAPSEPGLDGAAIAEALRKVLPADVVYAIRPTGDPFGEWGRAVLAALAAPAPSEPGLDADRETVLEWAYGYFDVNTELCRFDHHGGCQEHGYLSLDPGEECPQGAAQRAYARLRGGQE